MSNIVHDLGNLCQASSQSTNAVPRRRFFKQCIAMGSLFGLDCVQAMPHSKDRSVALHQPKTDERLLITYFAEGRYLPSALAKINYLLRDYYCDEVKQIDSGLIDQLHALATLLSVRKEIEVVSGYRSPRTNAQLRRHSDAVARHSLHMEGRAVDIRVPGVAASVVRDAALWLSNGGVGYYPGNNFVHLDTGRFRVW